MRKIVIVAALALALALAGCAAGPQTPQERAAQQDQAMRLMLMGSMLQQMAPPPPITIHCIGCR